MKRIISAILVFVSLAAALAYLGCGTPYVSYRYEGPEYELHTVAAHNIIGARIFAFNDVKRLEQDEYGRIMFSYFVTKDGVEYDSYEPFSKDTVRFPGCYLCYCICQKSDDEYAYCYEDICWQNCGSDLEITSEEIEQLKERNDWGKPLDESKMTAYTLETADTAQHGMKPQEYSKCYGYAKAALNRQSDIPKSEVYRVECLSQDNYGRSLMVCLINKSDGFDMYLLMLEPDGSVDEANGFAKLPQEACTNFTREDANGNTEETVRFIRSFKEANGWNTPCSAAVTSVSDMTGSGENVR